MPLPRAFTGASVLARVCGDVSCVLTWSQKVLATIHMAFSVLVYFNLFLRKLELGRSRQGESQAGSTP